MITETHKNVPYVYVENEFGFELNAVTAIDFHGPTACCAMRRVASFCHI